MRERVTADDILDLNVDIFKCKISMQLLFAAAEDVYQEYYNNCFLILYQPFFQYLMIFTLSHAGQPFINQLQQ